MTRKTFRMLLVALILCIISLAVMTYVLITVPRQVIHFTPPEFEINALAGTPALSEADGYRPIDAGVYRFSICGELYLQDGAVDVYLTNAQDNDVWLKLVITDEQENVLGESGLIRPGEYVRSVAIPVPPAQSQDVKIVVMGYEPDTYYSMGNVSLYTRISVPPAQS